ARLPVSVLDISAVAHQSAGDGELAHSPGGRSARYMSRIGLFARYTSRMTNQMRHLTSSETASLGPLLDRRGHVPLVQSAYRVLQAAAASAARSRGLDRA